MAASYVFGYPRAALRTLREALPGHLAVAAFMLLLAWGWREAFAAPPPRGWRTPAGWILGMYAVACAGSLVASLVTRFGLRVVPRFERPLAAPPDTYSHGRALARRLRDVDRMAAAGGATPLLRFGLDAEAEVGWYDCVAARATLSLLLHPGSSGRLPRKVEAELRRLDTALAAGQAEGVRFRLEVVAGDSMNGMFWDHLRRSGYV